MIETSQKSVNMKTRVFNQTLQSYNDNSADVAENYDSVFGGIDKYFTTVFIAKIVFGGKLGEIGLRWMRLLR